MKYRYMDLPAGAVITGDSIYIPDLGSYRKVLWTKIRYPNLVFRYYGGSITRNPATIVSVRRQDQQSAA